MRQRPVSKKRWLKSRGAVLSSTLIKRHTSPMRGTSGSCAAMPGRCWRSMAMQKAYTTAIKKNDTFVNPYFSPHRPGACCAMAGPAAEAQWICSAAMNRCPPRQPVTTLGSYPCRGNNIKRQPAILSWLHRAVASYSLQSRQRRYPVTGSRRVSDTEYQC